MSARKVKRTEFLQTYSNHLLKELSWEPFEAAPLALLNRLSLYLEIKLSSLSAFSVLGCFFSFDPAAEASVHQNITSHRQLSTNELEQAVIEVSGLVNRGLLTKESVWCFCDEN